MDTDSNELSQYLCKKCQIELSQSKSPMVMFESELSEQDVESVELTHLLTERGVVKAKRLSEQLEVSWPGGSSVAKAFKQANAIASPLAAAHAGHALASTDKA